VQNDYSSFERWYTEKATRRDGKPPAARALVGYVMRLRGAQRISAATRRQNFWQVVWATVDSGANSSTGKD